LTETLVAEVVENVPAALVLTEEKPIAEEVTQLI